MTPTSAGADHRVESISVALRHIESLNAADEWNHSQAIEWSVKNRWYEFTLSRSEGKLALRDLWDYSHDLSILVTVTQRTIGGLNNSLRSGKLDRNRVSRLSMGSSKMMDEVGVICFSNFFRDAGQSTATTARENYTNQLANRDRTIDFVTKLKQTKILAVRHNILRGKAIWSIHLWAGVPGGCVQRPCGDLCWDLTFPKSWPSGDNVRLVRRVDRTPGPLRWWTPSLLLDHINKSKGISHGNTGSKGEWQDRSEWK